MSLGLLSTFSDRDDVLFTLEWAKVDLVEILAGSATREKPWGVPDPSKPIFIAAEAQTLRISQRFERVEKRASGAPFPMDRHLSQEHVISIDKVLIAKPDPADDQSGDYVITPNKLMALRILWIESPIIGQADADVHWMQRVYYGVTGPEYSLSGSDDSVAFTGDKSLRAWFFRRKQGKGTPPALT